MNLDNQRLKTLDEVRAFLAGSSQFDFNLTTREDAYVWIETTLRQLGYLRLGKTDKGVVKAYVEKATGFSRAQVKRRRRFEKTRPKGVKIGDRRKAGLLKPSLNTCGSGSIHYWEILRRQKPVEARAQRSLTHYIVLATA